MRDPPRSSKTGVDLDAADPVSATPPGIRREPMCLEIRQF